MRVKNRFLVIVITVITVSSFMTGIGFNSVVRVFAEQSGSTPESGATSYIKQIYDSLVVLAHGSDSAGSWGDWGAYWNRIRSAGEWVPSGDAALSDVISGKTFYNSSRSQQIGTWMFGGDATLSDVFAGKTFYNNSNVLQTGTWAFSGDAAAGDVALGKTFYSNSSVQQIGTSALIDYSQQSLVEYDDDEYGDSHGAGDAGTEESIWTSTSTNVYQDERTDLYWSNDLGNFTNIFPDQNHLACPFFSLPDRGSYDGLTGACGNAINVCGTLSLDANNDGTDETDWYLPTQKELMQAYIDGMYNKAGAGFTTTNSFWASTEVSAGPTIAWTAYLYRGYTSYGTKASGYAVRCVRRD